VSFIANGSILPRAKGTELPLQDAVPFQSPVEDEVELEVLGLKLRGMGIKEGVTVITGGGYSGKSTLMEAMFAGISNHIPGDGREFCLTNHTSVKICAEDGRPTSEFRRNQDVASKNQPCQNKMTRKKAPKKLYHPTQDSRQAYFHSRRKTL
jgi:predicted ABC-class ATPase